jgi:hypothetical protein
MEAACDKARQHGIFLEKCAFGFLSQKSKRLLVAQTLRTHDLYGLKEMSA